MQPSMVENFDKATWDRLVESMTPKTTPLENKAFFPDIGDDKLSLTASNNNNNTSNPQQYIPPIPPKKISMTSSNDGDYDSNDTQTPKSVIIKPSPRNNNNMHKLPMSKHLIASPSDDTQDSEAADDPTELNAMRDQLFGLVSQEAQSRGMTIAIPSNQMNIKYGDDPKANELISLYNQQSLQNVIQSITTPAPQTTLPSNSSSANVVDINNNMNNTRSSTPTPKQQQAPNSVVLSPVSLTQNQPSPQNSHSHSSPSRAANMPSMQPQESHPMQPMQAQQSHPMQPMQAQQSHTHSMQPMQTQQSHSMQPMSAQQSHHSVQQQQQPPTFEQQGTIHPAVQKLYDLQQELLQKLVLLEKDDPDPQSAKLWGIMQRIFTEENAQQRQQNIADLTSTLEEKHKEVQEMNETGDNNLSISDQRLLRSIHEMSKETKNELKEMRQQLNEERKKNNELRSKIRKKNRQLKVLSSEINNNDDDDDGQNNLHYTIPPMAYDPNVFDSKARGGGLRQTISFDEEESVSSFGFVDAGKNQPSSFHKFCINMGFQPSEKKCSWF